jgi:lipoprotein-anchoring transpeptidase ErfK/SrfK
LSATLPDPQLSKMDITIAKVNFEYTDAVPLYNSVDDAVAKQNQIGSMEPAKSRYVSIINSVVVNGKAYVQLKTGEWLRASPAAYPKFQGLLFNQTPKNSFGWIIDQTRARTGAGYAYAETGPALYRYDVVSIYDIQTANATDWYMINPGHWVERRYIRQVRINTTPPDGVKADRWIDVNLYDQTLAVYENGQMIFATLVATGGDPFFTRPGTFQIKQKKPFETMQGSFEANRSDFYDFQDVPWTMYFDENRALHGAYWRAFFGYAGTHGCVNLSVGDSHWLYDWAKEGDYVHVWDPSGKTPTDPKLYGAGGA